MVASQATNSDLVRDGENCLTYDRNSPATIVAALERLLSDSDLRRCLATRARALVEAKYSLAAMGDAYDRLLRSLA